MKRDGLAHGAHVHTTQPQLDAEASRLVPAVSTQRERRQGTATSSLFNLIISAVGAGLLSYPYAFASEGALVCILTTALCALGNVFTVRVMARFTQKARALLMFHTFEELVLLALGRRSFAVAAFCVVGGVFGALIGFFIIIGDLAQDPLERLFGADSFFASRGFAVAFVATVLVFPMSLTKRIHGLLLSNAVAIASVVGVAGVVIWRGARVVWQHEGSGEPHVVEWARGSFTVLLGLPISIFSLGCQTQVPPVVSEASPQAEKSLGAVIALGSSFCAVLYVLTGLFGYFEFGPGVSGDIFSDYGDTSISVVIAKVVMAIHIAMASPVLMFPARRCIGFLIHRRGVAAAMAESNCTVAVLNAIMLGLTGLLAVAYPQVATVFGFVGATIATTELYVLPAMMMMAEARVCGGDSAYASVGHTTSEAEIGETPHLSPSNTAATPHTLNHRVSTVLRNFPTPLVAYVPCGHRDLLDPRQQPERLLRAGKIMLGTGLVVGCLCTGVIIYTKAS